MTTLKEFNRFGEELEKILLLRTSPIAVKMLAKKADIPAGSIRPKKDRNYHLAQCQAFAMSRREGATVTMLKEDHWCPAALMAYGMVEVRGPVQGHPYERFEYGKYIGIVTAPLKSATFKPDVVIVFSNTSQLRGLLLSMNLDEVPEVNGRFFPPSCAHAVVTPSWDFGGQDVYRVTHQFFFSRRSLYLLVWEPRRGVQQGQVEDWLNMIRLRVGDDARVIIVSTHCKTGERIARIDQPVFKQQYGDMIVGFHEVDSLVPDEATGEMVGIAELKKVIAEHASKLEQMGMGFNRDWKAARDELLARPEPRISYSTFSGVCAARGLSGIDTETLAHLMHDLGYIVHYATTKNCATTSSSNPNG